jgi:hypothetical protein
MTTLREAAQQALEALILADSRDGMYSYAKEIAALRAALAEPTYPLPDDLYPGSKDWVHGSYAERVQWLHMMYASAKEQLELYAAPQPRKRLTDEELRQCAETMYAEPLYAHHYDQTALELCDVCGWKTLIPGEGCLNCERQPKAEQEPVAWMWQHDETGRTGFVDSWQLANGWQEQNPRLHIVSPLYAAPQPRRRLTDEEIRDLWSWSMTAEAERTANTQQHAFARAIEAAVWGDGK